METLDYALIGFNIRCLRMARNFTQAELAEMAAVDKATIYRLERGLKVHYRTLQKIAKGFGETVPFINSVLPYGLPGASRRILVHRTGDHAWFSSADTRKRIPEDSQRLIQDDRERFRLGALGLIASFQAYMVVMPNGPAVAQVEVFARCSVGPNPSYKDCILVCMRGAAIFRSGSEAITLLPGDSVGYPTDEEATVEPAGPLDPSLGAPLIWAITANRRGHVPIAFTGRKRMRTRHNRSVD